MATSALETLVRSHPIAHHMQEEVQAPAAVRAVDLVDAVWPPGEEPRPQVQLPIWQTRCCCFLSSLLPSPDAQYLLLTLISDCEAAAPNMVG